MRTGFVVIASLLLLAACGSAPAAPTAAAPTEMPGGSSVTAAPAVTSAPASPAGEGATAAPAVEGNICHLVTIEEIETATGRPAALAEAIEDGQCSWAIDEVGDRPGGFINLIFQSADSTDLAFYRLSSDGEDRTGVGQDAYWAERFNTLFFVHGGDTYAVEIVLWGGDPDSMGIAGAVALAAIARV